MIDDRSHEIVALRGKIDDLNAKIRELEDGTAYKELQKEFDLASELAEDRWKEMERMRGAIMVHREQFNGACDLTSEDQRNKNLWSQIYAEPTRPLTTVRYEGTDPMPLALQAENDQLRKDIAGLRMRETLKDWGDGH